jgi:hypothetical protein
MQQEWSCRGNEGLCVSCSSRYSLWAALCICALPRASISQRWRAAALMLSPLCASKRAAAPHIPPVSSPACSTLGYFRAQTEEVAQQVLGGSHENRSYRNFSRGQTKARLSLAEKQPRYIGRQGHEKAGRGSLLRTQLTEAVSHTARARLFSSAAPLGEE